MFNVFGYLRKAARDAVLGGVADALTDLAPADPPADLDRLRALLAGEAKALAAADPTPAGEAEPATGGKRRK